jgi:lysophospholipase L1-like esterase
VHVPLEKYEANLTAIAAACEKAGARVAFCTPPPINEEPYFTRHKKAPFDAAGGLQKVLADYRATVVKVADARKAPVVDLNELLKARPEWMAPDGVHPTAEGTKLIAKEVARVVEPLLK